MKLDKNKIIHMICGKNKSESMIIHIFKTTIFLRTLFMIDKYRNDLSA